MSVRYLGVQTYAGGFDVGATQAGLQLVGRIEDRDGFGLRQCEANRLVLGDTWESQAADPADWEPLEAEVILTNPPCSAFSSMTVGVSRASHGMHSSINECMWNSIRYAAKVKPLVYVMESVQGAVNKGAPLMRQLRDELEALTGLRYHLTHVLQNNGALGGASVRRRYFMVMSRVPFGIELPEYGPPPVLKETIGDLEPLDPLTWGQQRYQAQSSTWVKDEVLSSTGTVDGHVSENVAEIGNGRLTDLLGTTTAGAENWPSGTCLVTALRTYYSDHGKLPESWHYPRRGGWADEILIARNMDMGFMRPQRWRYDRVAHVITGGSMWNVVHPAQPRTLSHRECARIMGFPDNWLIEPLQGLRSLALGWGKGVSVQAGRWVAHWVRRAVLNEPGSYVGTSVTEHHRLRGYGPCERETVIDVSKLPKQSPLTNDAVVEILVEN